MSENENPPKLTLVRPPNGKSSVSDYAWPEKRIEEHSLAQGFTDEFGFYFVRLPRKDAMPQSSLITSKKEIISVQYDALKANGIRLKSRYYLSTDKGVVVKAPLDLHNWSTDTEARFNVKEYLQGATINP